MMNVIKKFIRVAISMLVFKPKFGIRRKPPIIDPKIYPRVFVA